MARYLTKYGLNFDFFQINQIKKTTNGLLGQGEKDCCLTRSVGQEMRQVAVEC